jgi:hypothetical protein
MSSEVLGELMRRSEALSDEEKLRLAHHLLVQAKKSKAGEPEGNEAERDATSPDPRRREEQRWLLQHGSQYAGEWVALNGNCLLSHGTDGRVVLSEARRGGVAVPFVVRVEKPDELPFGGW